MTDKDNDAMTTEDKNPTIQVADGVARVFVASLLFLLIGGILGEMHGYWLAACCWIGSFFFMAIAVYGLWSLHSLSGKDK